MSRLFFILSILPIGLSCFAQDNSIIDVAYVMEQLDGLTYEEQIATLTQEYLDRLHSEPELSEKILELSLNISKEKNDSLGIANALYYLGYANREHGKSSESVTFFKSSLAIYDKLGVQPRVSDCLNDLGIAYKNLGDFQKSLDFYYEALKIAEENNYNKGQVTSLSNISVILTNQGNHKQAIQYLERSLEFDLEESKKTIIYNNLGVAYNALNKKDEALINYEKSIESAKLTNDTFSQIKPMNNIGVILLERREYDKALEYFLEVEKNEIISSSERGLIGTYINIGLINRMKGKYEEAISYFLKANELAIKTKSPYEQKTVYINLALGYEDWGKYKQSIDYIYLYIYLNDSLFTETKNLQMAELTSQYETDRKQKQIELLQQEKILKGLAMQKQKSEFALEQLKAQALADKKQNEFKLLQKQNEIQKLVLENNVSEIERLKVNASLNESIIQNEQSKVERQATIRNITILISLLIVVPVLILLVLYQQKIKAHSIVAVRNEQLNQKKTLELIRNFEIKTFKAQLEGQEKERQRIASELHDGVGGTLAGIKLRLNNMVDASNGGRTELKQIMEQVDETCVEIRTISHDLTPSKIFTLAYIDLIKDYILKNTDPEKITINFQAFPEEELNYISDDIKIEVYRIIQELLSNALKHSNAKEIDISLTLNTNSLILMIEDSGIGFDANKVDHGIGLHNIDSRATSVAGKLNIDSKLGRGTIVTVEIPISEVENLVLS